MKDASIGTFCDVLEKAARVQAAVNAVVLQSGNSEAVRLAMARDLDHAAGRLAYATRRMKRDLLLVQKEKEIEGGGA